MAIATLCRDCQAWTAGDAPPSCASCGSSRLVSHAELDRLAIAHIDCDAFYATIEKRDDPSLQARPVIVGGGRRGVVTTACYIARTFGVRSAMPMFKALKACPEAVVIRPDMAKYARVSREVRALMLELTPLVEPVSIDEAFLDLSGTQALHGAPPAGPLARFAARVEREIGITVSVGLSFNKFLGEIASDLAKPRGFSVLGAAEARDFLADKPIGLLPGIGKVAQERLARAGVRLVGDVRSLNASQLGAAFGRDAARLRDLAQARDDRPVTPERETKSISAETTFETDTADRERLRPVLMRLAEKVSARMKHSRFGGRAITLKLKTSDFRLLTRSRSGLPATALAGRIYRTAQMLLDEAPGGSYRLIGIGVSDLCPLEEADAGDLADQGAAREAQRERAVDRLREKFGEAAITRGVIFGARRPEQP